jgi:predicted transcriptional regulator
MSKKPLNSSETGEEESKINPGRSMADVLTLPDVEQNFVTWVIRHKEVSLAETVAYLNQEEAAVCEMLKLLCNQGFVQEIQVEDELHYRPCIAAKPKSRASGKLWQDLD